MLPAYTGAIPRAFLLLLLSEKRRVAKPRRFSNSLLKKLADWRVSHLPTLSPAVSARHASEIPRERERSAP